MPQHILVVSSGSDDFPVFVGDKDQADCYAIEIKEQGFDHALCQKVLVASNRDAPSDFMALAILEIDFDGSIAEWSIWD